MHRGLRGAAPRVFPPLGFVFIYRKCWPEQSWHLARPSQHHAAWLSERPSPSSPNVPLLFPPISVHGLKVHDGNEGRWSCTGSDYGAQMIRFALMNAVRKWPPQKEWLMILIAAPAFGSCFSLTSSPLTMLHLTHPSSIPPVFSPAPPHVKVTAPAPHPPFTLYPKKKRQRGVEQSWHAAGLQVAYQCCLDWEGRRRGGGVLSRAATSSQCVESIFSRVNRGIPAHRSRLPSQDQAVGGCTRMDDTSLLLSPSAAAAHPPPDGEKRCTL